MPEKVTDPRKIVTDKLVLKRLAEQGIDKDFVEFFQDYAPRSLGKEHSPYAKFYRDLKSGKRIMVVSGLPKVKPDGQKIEVGWVRQGIRYVSKANLFSAMVNGKQVTVTCLSDQPSGSKEGEQVTWQPQLFLDGLEIINGEQATLLPVDPINAGYAKNTLEWSYGTICKRRIRIIEGRFRERWVFESNPYSTVRIKHNFNGSLKLRLGDAIDAEDNFLKVTVIGDEELIEASEFDKAVYPVEIGGGLTVYPDADPETSSVDGYTSRAVGNNTWDDYHDGVGTAGVPVHDTLVVGLSVGAGAPENEFSSLHRAAILFDTSGLPDNAVKTAAVLGIYGRSKLEGVYTPTVNIYSVNLTTNTNIIAADYIHTRWGTTPFCDTPIAYADWNIGTPGTINNFALNAAGIAAIPVDGVAKFSMRLVADATDVRPGWTVNQNTRQNGWQADKGTSYKPKLVVTYTEPPAPTFMLDPKPRTRAKFYPSLKLGG